MNSNIKKCVKCQIDKIKETDFYSKGAKCKSCYNQNRRDKVLEKNKNKISIYIYSPEFLDKISKISDVQEM